MAITVSKSGGIYIEISGDYSQLQKDLRAVTALSKAAGADISNALGGAIDPKNASKSIGDLAKSLMKAQAAGVALGADFASQTQKIREWGHAAGLAGRSLDNFMALQAKAFQKQAAQGFTKELRDIQRQTGATDAEMSRLAKSLGGAGNELDKATRSGAALGSCLKGTALQISGTLLGIRATGEVAGKVVDAVSAAGKYNMLGIAMEQVGRNAGYSRQQLSGYEQELRKTGISMMEARQSITQLMQSNIDLEQASKLARVAQNAAVIGGVNSTEAYSRLIHGIQSGQTDVLRGIGLNVDFEKSYQKMAASLGKNSSALTEQEKAQARANAAEEAGIRINGAYEASLDSAYKRLTSLPRYLSEISIMAGGAGMDVFAQGVDGVSRKVQSLHATLSAWEADGTLEVASRAGGVAFGAIVDYGVPAAAAMAAMALSKTKFTESLKESASAAMKNVNAIWGEATALEGERGALAAVQDALRGKYAAQVRGIEAQLKETQATWTAVTAELAQADASKKLAAGLMASANAEKAAAQAKRDNIRAAIAAFEVEKARAMSRVETLTSAAAQATPEQAARMAPAVSRVMREEAQLSAQLVPMKQELLEPTRTWRPQKKTWPTPPRT